MALRPICEPVDLPPGASVIAEQVTVAGGSAAGRFMHFHDVAELVLFRRVRGKFIAGGRRHRLHDGAVVFVPSMHRHDFILDGDDMKWVLIQIDPYQIEALALQPALARLARPFCAWPDATARRRIDMLADWLVETAAETAADPAIARIVELLLLAVAEAPEHGVSDADESSAGVDRLLPVLERLRTAPAEPITLDSAAAMCRLSPAYFSRRFKQVLGMTFTDYARVYRLHLAARRIITTGASVAEIGYGVGFSSPSHFSARFHQRFGMTPREYRRSARARASGGGGRR
jgi:AraC-like DNA-binding protein